MHCIMEAAEQMRNHSKERSPPQIRFRGRRALAVDGRTTSLKTATSKKQLATVVAKRATSPWSATRGNEKEMPEADGTT